MNLAIHLGRYRDTHGEASPLASFTLIWSALPTKGRMLPSIWNTWCIGPTLANVVETTVWRRPPLLIAIAAMQGIAEKAKRATMADGPRLKRDMPTTPIDSPSESFFIIVLTKPPAPGA